MDSADTPLDGFAIKSEIETFQKELDELNAAHALTLAKINTVEGEIDTAKLAVAKKNDDIQILKDNMKHASSGARMTLKRAAEYLNAIGTVPDEEEDVRYFIQHGKLGDDNLATKIEGLKAEYGGAIMEEAWKKGSGEGWKKDAILLLDQVLGFDDSFDKDVASKEEIRRYNRKREVIANLLAKARAEIGQD